MKKLSDLSIGELKSKILNTKSFASMIKSIEKNPCILEKVNYLIKSDFDDSPLIEKLYSIRENLSFYPKCKICNKNANMINGKGWSDFCDGNCGYLNRWNNISDDKKNQIFKKLSINYHNKTKSEKNDIKNKRSKTLLDRYGVNHNFKIDEVIKNRKKTWIKKYGYDNPNKSNLIKNKIISTNNERYGNNCPLQNLEILKKSKETLFQNHGVEHNSQSDIFKENFKKTSLKNHGHSHPMHSSEIHDKCIKNSYNYKLINLNDMEYKVQGYEPFAIEYLLSTGISEKSFIIKNKDITNITGIIKYLHNDKIKRYYPDLYVTENETIYEIKSEYTYMISSNDGSLTEKIKACKLLGFNVKVLVFDKNKKLIKEI